MPDPDNIVVVGAGASGCLLAARLAAAGRRVVLIEAGPDLRGREQPVLRDGWAFSREYAWGFASEPDASGRSTPVLRTRAVGGTAWVTRFAVRSHQADFAVWNELVGGGWAFAETLSAFCAVERDEDYPGEPWHGADGPIWVTRYPQVASTQFEAAFRAALRGDGVDPEPDLNRPGARGFGRVPMSSHGGRRSISADLLDDAPANLVVRSNTTVERVVIEEGRATGVSLVEGPTIPAGTVVLAAGVYGSPCLLLRSGIGPARALNELGIEVLVDLPGVGMNLSDHPAVSIDTGYRGVQRARELSCTRWPCSPRRWPTPVGHRTWRCGQPIPRAIPPRGGSRWCCGGRARGGGFRSAHPTPRHRRGSGSPNRPRRTSPSSPTGSDERFACSTPRHCARSARPRRRTCPGIPGGCSRGWARSATRCPTPSEPARWGRRPPAAPSSTPARASTASTACTSRTPPSCRDHRRAFRTSPH